MHFGVIFFNLREQQLEPIKFATNLRFEMRGQGPAVAGLKPRRGLVSMWLSAPFQALLSDRQVIQEQASVWGYRGPLSTAGIEICRDGRFHSDRGAFWSCGCEPRSKNGMATGDGA